MMRRLAYGTVGFGLLVGLLLAPIVLCATRGRAEVQAPAPAAPTVTAVYQDAHRDTTEAWLAVRGLMGQTMPGGQSGPNMIKPPSGVEVDETVQRANQTGQEMLRIRSWNEPAGDNLLHIELTDLPTLQYQVAFWLLPRHQRGCAVFGQTMYDESGRALKSVFWRNDPALKVAGAADFPRDLCPDSVPALAFLRALQAPRKGAGGTLSQQVTPYNYVKQDVRASDTERVEVPAGEFSALKVTAQAEVSTLLPSWPRLVLSMIRPFIPTNTYYFQSEPPHRLLKAEGATFVGGPEVTTELVSYRYVEKPEKSAAARPELLSASSSPAQGR
jgi:hypothetical protein